MAFREGSHSWQTSGRWDPVVIRLSIQNGSASSGSLPRVHGSMVGLYLTVDLIK